MHTLFLTHKVIQKLNSSCSPLQKDNTRILTEIISPQTQLNLMRRNFLKVAYNGSAKVLKPIMVRGARISDTTIKNYGKNYIFETVVGTKIQQTSMMILKDEIVR